MSKHTPGRWRIERVITPYLRERLDPAKPFEVSRREGRFSVRMRDDAGQVRSFATEAEARAAIKKAEGA